MKMRFRRVDWEFVSVFRTAARARSHAQTVLVELDDGERVGRGEASGVPYHGETVDGLLEQLASFAGAVSSGISRAELQGLLPAGGARNALDCALWDLEAKRSARRVWELAGLPMAKPLFTAYTLSLDTAEVMARAAESLHRYPLLKLKLTGEEDLERVGLVRRARPDAQLIVDANQAWDERALRELTPALAGLGVTLIEQPLAAGQDHALATFRSPVPLCADESCQTSRSLPAVVGKYQYINIKLDKTGGLTEALRLARLAQEAGLRLMVGSMGGSSLGMAPATIVGQLCDVVDLDAPLLTKGDVPDAIRYEGHRMAVPGARLWG
jgi:L-Ala-D/L-Glu epimerase